ncbi:MAG TPA: sigma-70 family RNA polymerase sigma factor, partial [Rhodospirillales bacterium]|nr:sigma-70 family RNA polymerase sigma factor [Rhodospirillales bacterium]
MSRSEEERARIEDLLAVARRRDREAFGRLFDYYAPRVKAYLRRLGADPQQAEELAQEVMLTVWRRAARYDPRRATPATWIFRIARNRRIDALRRERRPPEAEEIEVEAEAGGEEEATELPGEALEARSEALLMEEKLRAAIARLPPEQAEILRLYYLEE